MNKIPTAKEILKSFTSFNSNGGIGLAFAEEAMLQFARIHVTEALKKAAEIATVEVIDHEEMKVISLPGYDRTGEEVILPIYGVDEDSILNSYPLSNIK